MLLNLLCIDTHLQAMFKLLILCLYMDIGESGAMPAVDIGNV